MREGTTGEQMPDREWQVLDTRTEYRGRMSVMRDRLRKPDGNEMDYTYVAGRDAVAVLAFAADDQIVLTRQYRHPLRRTIFDLPAGGVNADEPLEQAAARELREETGYTTQTIELLGRFYPAPGLRSSTVHVFVAHSLAPGPPAPDEHEVIDVVLMPWHDALELVLSEDATDSALAYAVLRYAVQQQAE